MQSPTTHAPCWTENFALYRSGADSKQISQNLGGGRSEPPTLKFNMQKEKKTEKKWGCNLVNSLFFGVATLLEL